MKVRRPYWLAAFFLLVLCSVIFYNLWAYSCGRCTLSMFRNPGPIGMILMGLILVTAALLPILRHRRRARQAKGSCHCGVRVMASWGFCPGCGGSLLK